MGQAIETVAARANGDGNGAARPSSLADIAQTLDRALAETSDLRMRMVHIAQLVPGRIAFSTSLGLEDQAVLHAIAAANAPVDVFTLDTGRHFPETYEVLDVSIARYGVPIRIVAPEAGALERLVARDGVFGFRRSVEARKACCFVRKVQPLEKALAGASGWITGLRREQAASRTAIPFAEYDAAHDRLKINPVADWTLDTLETYIDTFAIPTNALHRKGFPSIGCQPCTRAIAPGEDIRAGRWWWEQEAQAGATHKECGLHVSESAAPAAGA